MMDDESQNSRLEDHGLAPADDRAEIQEPEVNHSRRNLARAGVAAPILMTLASRPVFGNPVNGQCLSNIMSGNLSTQNNGNCSLGDGPEAWKSPTAFILGVPSFILGVPSNDAWSATGFEYGDVELGEAGTDCSQYTGGTTLGDTVLSGLGGGTFDAKPLRQILCDGDSISNCVAALLNARFSVSPPPAAGNYKYILNEQGVVNFCSGAWGLSSVGTWASLDDFLEYTFNVGTY